MDREIEEVERIPWAMLADDIEGRPRRWILQAGGMVVVAAIVGVIALQVMRRPSGTTVDLTPVDSAVAEGAPAAPTVSAQGLVAAPLASPGDVATAVGAGAMAPPHEAPLYSEADLMAVLPGQPSLYAAARAEWFVVDFFGATGDGPVAGLPSGVPVPEVGDGYSWVEWAKAIQAEPRPGGGFDVTVAFRTLTGSEDAGYRRLPVRAVVVPIAVDEEGRAAVADLPTPVEILDTEIIEGPDLEEEPPQEVAEAASTAAASFGSAATVVGGSVDATGGWRVVVRVGDESGVVWPFAVHVDP